MDGTNCVNWAGEIGYDPTQIAGAYTGLDVKDGIYQPDANDGHTFYFDQICFTTNYNDAAVILGWKNFPAPQ
jgi:hypothetical protein